MYANDNDDDDDAKKMLAMTGGNIYLQGDWYIDIAII